MCKTKSKYKIMELYLKSIINKKVNALFIYYKLKQMPQL